LKLYIVFIVHVYTQSLCQLSSDCVNILKKHIFKVKAYESKQQIYVITNPRWRFCSYFLLQRIL